MPRNRTKYQAKREHELTSGELLDACGPSDAALQRAARIGLTPKEKKQRRREMELVDRYRRIGRMVRAFRRTILPSTQMPRFAASTTPRPRKAILEDV